MNRQEIMEILPHRPPMLLLDDAELLEDGLCRGSYRVCGDEWFLQGHFPENPVVPGVIICEMIAQSACVMMQAALAEGTPYYAGIDKVHFRKIVRPGDTLEFSCRLLRRTLGVFIIAGRAIVAGELACEGEFKFIISKM